MGPGRTGVKGVIRDRDEASENDRSKRAKDMQELNKRMERANLGGKTFLEEEREKKAISGLEEVEKRDVLGRKKVGRFGHLREVGVHGFVDAIEREDQGVWVVVHLYDPSLERCYMIDDTLTRLARIHPDTKFLHARASALGFASTSSGSQQPPPPSRIRNTDQDSEDDSYDAENEKYLDEEDLEFTTSHADVDTDMLPTMLVYRDGELVHNWVRVDWEAGEAGIEELLAKHRVLPQAFGNSVLLSDDEDDDLDWS